MPGLRSLIALATSVIAAAIPATAHAQDADETEAGPGAILFARDKAIWRASADGGTPEKVITLSDDASTVTRIEPGKSGKYVLVEAGGKTGYAKLRDGAVATVSPIACDRGAVLSPDGICIACLDAAGKVLIYALATGDKHVLAGVKARAIGFVSRTRLAAVSDVTGEIATWPISGKGKRQMVSPHVPADHFSVAPSGKRAVGTYQDGDAPLLYGFRLDGKAAKRKLGGTGAPRGWSADSKWVVLQDDQDVCVVRAIGGEYKCWEGYVGLALSPASDSVFLAKEKSAGAQKWELYRAPMAGARPATPVKISGVGESESAVGAWIK